MTPQDGSDLQGVGKAKKFGAEGFVTTDALLNAIREAEKRKERLDLFLLLALLCGVASVAVGIYLLFGLPVTLITLGVFVIIISSYASIKNNADGTTPAKKG